MVNKRKMEISYSMLTTSDRLYIHSVLNIYHSPPTLIFIVLCHFDGWPICLSGHRPTRRFFRKVNRAKRAFLCKFLNKQTVLSVKQFFLWYTSHKLIKLYTVPYNAQ